jgi:hypothetical protein
MALFWSLPYLCPHSPIAPQAAHQTRPVLLKYRYIALPLGDKPFIGHGLRPLKVDFVLMIFNGPL